MDEVKEIRFNADESNSERIRKIQDEYLRKCGLKLVLEQLANRAIELGISGLRKQLNLPNEE